MNEQKLPQSYKNFELAIADLMSDYSSADKLGSGSESNVYKLDLSDRAYVVKFARQYFHKR